MKKLLSEKTVTIIGGTGFVGLAVAKLCADIGITTYSISKRGRPREVE